MSEKEQIIFMQVRLLRLVSKKWQMSYEKVVELFKEMKLFKYIEDGFGIFHTEGDEVVLEDIEELLDRKGIDINARIV